MEAKLQSEYFKVANKAVSFEMNNQYKAAIEYWLQASTVAKNSCNRQWALNRSEFCKKMSLMIAIKFQC